MNRISFLFCLISCAFVLSACGSGPGGGGGGTSPPENNKAFTVNLEHVDITRVINGDSVTVDTSAITSGELNYKP